MGTLAAWSSTVLWLGFFLQLVLLALLIQRRLAAEVWVFTGLLLFYAVRSIVLYELAPHMPREAYGELYTGLSLADIVLQIALSYELLRSILRLESWRLPGIIAALAAAACVTAGIVALLPSRSPVPADRGAIFTGTLFAIVFGLAVRSRSLRLQAWPRALLTGLAVAGVSGAMAECGKTVAAFHRNGRVYVAWSYGSAAVYLLMLVYWIVAAMRQEHTVRSAHHSARLYARDTI